MDAAPLTLLPYGLPGKVFRSSMPFRLGDRDGQTLRAYLDQGVSVVVMLTDDDEAWDATGRDLRQVYSQAGLQVIYSPVDDFGIPQPQAFRSAVAEARRALEHGQNLAVHCYAGLGRTGTFLACLATEVLGMDAPQAVSWVRSYIPGAVENSRQVQFVREYAGR